MIFKHCPICNSPIARNDFACSSCIEKLRGDYFDNYMQRCPECLYPVMGPEYICNFSEYKILPISDYQSGFSKDILLNLKLFDKAEFAPIVAIPFNDYLPDDVTVVPVPCSNESFARRGWNHMDLVAKFLKKPVLNLIMRSDNNVQQKKLSKEERAANAAREFVLNKSLAEKTDKNIHLYIIDDVLTTGSTVKACIKLLKDAGFTEVGAMTWLCEF